MWYVRQEQVSVSQRHISKKKQQKQADMVQVPPKVGQSKNCARRTKSTTLQRCPTSQDDK